MIPKIDHNKMKEAGSIINDAFSFLISAIKEGKLQDSLLDVQKYLASRGAVSGMKMQGFPHLFSLSINEEVIQGSPCREAQEGDIVSIDMTIFYKGLFVDKARTFTVGKADYRKVYLTNAVNRCLSEVPKHVRAGMTSGNIGSLIESVIKYLGLQPGKEFFGHSIGHQPHLKPLIPNYNDGSIDPIIEGSYITLEPVIFYGPYKVTYENWTILSDQFSAHGEDTFLVTKEGLEVVT